MLALNVFQVNFKTQMDSGSVMIVRKDVLLLALKEEHVQHALLVGCSKILQLFHAPSAPQASSKGYVGSGTAHVVRGDSMLLTLGHIHAWCAQMGRCRAISPLLHALHVLQANPKRIAEVGTALSV